MKTVNAPWSLVPAPARRDAATLPWQQYIAYATLALTALLPVSLITVAGAWAISAGAIPELAAAVWSAAFILLAAAVDSDRWRAALQAVSGAALAILAWLSYHLAPEFGVVAAVLAGAWLSVSLAERIVAALRRTA